FEKRGRKIIFKRADVNLWAYRSILTFHKTKLRHEVSHQSARGDASPSLPPSLSAMLAAGAILPAMKARTKASALRELVGVAAATRHVNNPAALLAALEAREQCGSTAVPGGLAFP